MLSPICEHSNELMDAIDFVSEFIRCQESSLSFNEFVVVCMLQSDVTSRNGGFDSHLWTAERPQTRPKSRAASRISLGAADETVRQQC